MAWRGAALLVSSSVGLQQAAPERVPGLRSSVHG